MKRTAFAAALLAALSASAGLYEIFVRPPVENRPWSYWFVMNSLTDRATIEADFADMAALGFGGVLVTDSRAYHVDDDHLQCPPATVRWGSAEWQELMAQAIRAAATNRLVFTLNIAASGGHLRGEMDAKGDNPKRLLCRRYRPGEPFEKPASPHFRDVAVFAVRTAKPLPATDWTAAGDGVVSSASSTRRRLDDASLAMTAALEARELKTAAEGAALGADWTVVRFGFDTIPNAPEDIDVLDRAAVARHLERSIGGLIRKVADLTGRDRTFRALYNVSWEGVMPTWSPTFEADYRRLTGQSLRPSLPVLAGFALPGVDAEAVRRDYRRARGRMMADNFYGEVRRWANAHRLLAFSESGGPWVRTPDVFGECDQCEFLSANDFPQGEFWPEVENGLSSCSGHANENGRYLHRGIVSTAHVVGAPYASAEAFTHMHRHWSADPAFLKPVGDQALADGINLLVWHTYTSSPARFGTPGLEYFAGTHINRNVTWHDDFAPFVTYLGRCQAVLQAGVPVVDVLLVGDETAYCHWSYGWQTKRAVKNGRHRMLASDEPALAVRIPAGYAHDFVSPRVLAAAKDAAARYPVVVTAKEALADEELLPRRLKEKGLAPDVAVRPGTWTWCHRRTDEGDFYFVAGEGDGTLVFRAAAPVVEQWDPVTGVRYAASAEVLPDGRTKVKAELPLGGSAVFAFLRTKPSSPAPRPAHLSRADAVRGVWDVSFAYPKGVSAPPPKTVQLTNLVDWTTREDLKYFSGTATYRAAFAFGGDPRSAKLSLGKVPTGLAHVFLNGRDCGTVWCAPWMCDISQALRRGANELEIRYTNNWYNRLVGDCRLKEKDRVTASNLHYWTGDRKADAQRPWRSIPTVFSGYCPNDPLQPSGLLGPVEVLSPGRNRGKLLTGIPYDASLGKAGLGDLYLPAEVDAKTPLLLLIHGGGWAGGAPSGMTGMAKFFSRDLGFAVYNIEYRLASEKAPWPACGEDCVKAARFLLSKEFASKYGLSNEKIWIAGGSAGGHLTLWTLVNLPPERVAGAVSVSSIGDPVLDFPGHPERYWPLFGSKVAKEALAPMNPIPLIRPGMAPVLFTHADADRVVPIASHRGFAEAYAKAGNRADFYEYSSETVSGLTGHCIWRPLVKPHKLISCLEARIAEFVKSVRNPSSL